MTRAVEPHEPTITPEIKAKHDASRRDFPHLNLSDGEYVISAVRRHPIGLVSIWAVVAAALLAIFVGVPFLFSTQSFFDSADMPLFSGGMILLLLGVLIVLGGVIATIVYRGNRFYLTNESVMQHIQFSLFSRKEQTISLANIEDASYRQHGFIQTLFNYGSLRLSTEGDETTYRFSFVAEPQRQVTLLNNAIEAFKNFRPINEQDD